MADFPLWTILENVKIQINRLFNNKAYIKPNIIKLYIPLNNIFKPLSEKNYNDKYA